MHSRLCRAPPSRALSISYVIAELSLDGSRINLLSIDTAYREGSGVLADAHPENFSPGELQQLASHAAGTRALSPCARSARAPQHRRATRTRHSTDAPSHICALSICRTPPPMPIRTGTYRTREHSTSWGLRILKDM